MTDTDTDAKKIEKVLSFCKSKSFPLNLHGATVNIFESTCPIYLKKRKTFRQKSQER